MNNDFNIKQLCNSDSAMYDLNRLNSNFKKLDRLNQILIKVLPPQLCDTCHIGAIDEIKSIVVIFVSNQQSFHLLRSLNNHILQAFLAEHFAFEKILMRVGKYKNNQQQNTKYKNINSADKDKLMQLALAINKPELIVTKVNPDINTDDELLF